MSVRLGKTRLRIHPLLPLLWGFMLLSGRGQGLLPAIAAWLLHESGHFAAARLLQIPIASVEITPFGGVTTPNRYDGVSPAARFFYAAAGPLMSLAGCFLAALLYRRNVPFAFLQRFARANLLLLTVNLLPALPLDGGEMLRAVLIQRFSHAAVTKALTCAGWAVGIALGTLSLLAACRGEIILFPLFAGAYLIYAVSLERRECSARYVTALIARRQRLDKNEVLPVEFLAAGADMPAGRLLSRLSLNKYHVIRVLAPDGMACLGDLDEKAFCDLVMNTPDAPIGEMMKKPTKKGDQR